MIQVSSCEQALIRTNRKPIQNQQSKAMLLFKTYTLEFEFDRHLEHMVLAFCYRGAEGRPPKTTFAPLKVFKNNRKNNGNNSLLFKNNGVLSFVPLKFYSRKPGLAIREYRVGFPYLLQVNSALSRFLCKMNVLQSLIFHIFPTGNVKNKSYLDRIISSHLLITN